MFFFFSSHVLLSQEQHSINVLLSLSCPTSTEDKIQYKFYPLLSRLASTRTTFNICLVLVILSWIHKNEIQYMFYLLFSCLTSTITTLHMFSFCYLVMFLLCCLMSVKKKTQHSIHVLHFVVLACFHTNNTMCTMARSRKYNHGNILQKPWICTQHQCVMGCNTPRFLPMPN